MTDTVQAQFELPFTARPPAAGQTIAVIDGRAVSYNLVRRRGRSRISISIDERGLRVGAPLRAPLREIEDALQKHAKWILRKLGEWQMRSAPPLCWTDGETLMLRGEPVALRTGHAERGAALAGNSIRVASTTPAQVAREVTTWLRQHALGDFVERAARFLPVLGVKAPRIRLSNARTRWGSCHASGSILLNWRLIQMPPRLIDYVVVHELAHLREMNHSPRFWAIVGDVIADHNERRSEIRREGHRYLLV